MPVPRELLQDPDPWRWHAATLAVFGSFLAAGPLRVLLRQLRERPLLMQFWLLGQILVAGAWSVASWPAFELQQVIIIADWLVTYPGPWMLLSLRGVRPAGKALLGPGLLAAWGWR